MKIFSIGDICKGMLYSRRILFQTFFFLGICKSVTAFEASHTWRAEFDYYLGPTLSRVSGIDSLKNHNTSEDRFGSGFWKKGFGGGLHWLPVNYSKRIRETNSFFFNLLKESGVFVGALYNARHIVVSQESECQQIYSGDNCNNSLRNFTSNTVYFIGISQRIILMRFEESYRIAIGGTFGIARSILSVGKDVSDFLKIQNYSTDSQSAWSLFYRFSLGFEFKINSVWIGLSPSFLMVDKNFHFSNTGPVEIRNEWSIPISAYVVF